MSGTPALVLRDIHEPVPPPWWPPATGWWLLAAVVLLVLLALAWRGWRRRRRMRGLARLFDDTVAAAGTPSARIAAMSALLRRATLRHDPRAATLEGAAWLAYLDHGSSAPLFDDADAQWLLEGGYRREVDPGVDDRLLPRARARFLEWMARR